MREIDREGMCRKILGVKSSEGLLFVFFDQICHDSSGVGDKERPQS